MVSFEPFYQYVISTLQESTTEVTGAGIRYGSVAYLGFGRPKLRKITSRLSGQVYPFELELGADHWEVRAGKSALLCSEFEDVEKARKDLGRALLGSRLRAIDVADKMGTIRFDRQLILLSHISDEPGSGFLYSFHVDSGPSFETVDGINVTK